MEQNCSLFFLWAGLPPEIVQSGIGLIPGIDPLPGMLRTAETFAGHCLAGALIARRQGSVPGKTYSRL